MENEVDNGFEKLSPNDEEVSSSSATHSGVEDLQGSGFHGSEASLTSKPVGGRVDELGHGATTFQPSVCPAKAEKSSEGSSGNLLKSIDPRVVDLLLWRDIKKTGVVFASAVIVLLSLSFFSVLSVIAYFGLVVLTLTTGFRVYCKVMVMMNKSTESALPFEKYLEFDLTIPEDKVHHLADAVAKYVSRAADSLRRLFLVENIVDSLKFGLVLWLLTYVGSWFNGLTLVLLGTIDLFTLPKVYDTYKVQIDQYAHLACSKFSEIYKKVQEKLPMLAKKKQA
jgi:hypothetical protein